MTDKIARQIIEGADHAILRIEGAACVAFAEAGITVDIGASMIREMHLRHAVSSHFALVSQEIESPYDPRVLDHYDHEAFMKIVSDIALRNIETIRNHIKKRQN